ncbi:hypothetical protein, partial [Erythrobacter sp. YJ-T3-07]|uniref:hypothetical protein n=1 Tax=Erythrobacter sp. YJ-T3-07 TaxID=2793063 RepID=UPI0018D2B6BE
MKRLGLKTENSKVTSEPTINNQSEPEHDKAPPVPKIPRIVADAEAKSVSDASFWSADVSLSSGPKGIISNRTAIARKPLPIRKNSFETSQVEVKTGKNGYTYPELQHLKLGFEEVTISVTHAGSSSPEDTLTE